MLLALDQSQQEGTGLHVNLRCRANTIRFAVLPGDPAESCLKVGLMFEYPGNSAHAALPKDTYTMNLTSPMVPACSLLCWNIGHFS